MKTATIHQAKTHLSRLLKDVQGGETVVILNRDVPVAKLTAVEPSEGARPKVGTITSAPVKYAEGAFAPLSDDDLQEWDL